MLVIRSWSELSFARRALIVGAVAFVVGFAIPGGILLLGPEYIPPYYERSP